MDCTYTNKGCNAVKGYKQRQRRSEKVQQKTALQSINEFNKREGRCSERGEVRLSKYIIQSVNE